MVQVDVFWSYGLGSGLALAAGRQLEKKEEPWINPYFIGTVLWIALFFATSGLYLLWNFPYWETMFLARDHADIPAWLAVLFAVTNITQGILGYYVVWRLLRAGNKGLAKFQAVWSHAAMLLILIFGWDGSGWRRFTYAGTGDDWRNNVALPWTQFFSSPVFHALLGMGVILVPTYFYLVRRWLAEPVEA